MSARKIKHQQVKKDHVHKGQSFAPEIILNVRIEQVYIQGTTFRVNE